MTPAEQQAAALLERSLAVRAVGLDEFTRGTSVQPHWAVRDIWPAGASGVIGGRPKDGKSTLAAELAISLWSGTPMFGLERFPVGVVPVPVLYVQQENANARVKRDLQKILIARGLGYEGDGDFALNAVGDECYAEAQLDVMSHQGINLSARSVDRLEVERRLEAVGYRYLFLDPLYNLVGGTKIGDGGDELRDVLGWLTHLKNELGVAVVLTHHMSNKGGQAHGASAMLGTTYLHAWYEAALFTQKAEDSAAFTVSVDALRDIGVTEEHSLQGLGVGSWYYTESAQGVRTSDGRRAPQVAAALTNEARLADLVAEHPDWTNAQYATALGVSTTTARRYKRNLANGGGVQVSTRSKERAGGHPDAPLSTEGVSTDDMSGGHPVVDTPDGTHWRDP